MSFPESKELVTPATSQHIEAAKHHRVIDAVPLEQEAHQDVHHVNLGWRSWVFSPTNPTNTVVVFVASVALFAQTHVVVAAGSVIAFIVRDLGDAPISGWIIQGPLLMQSVLSPVVGRLSDVTERKYMAALPPLLAFVGAVISAKATSMNMLIGGGILIGTTLATVPIVHAISAEVLPLKYRSLASGAGFVSGAFAGLVTLMLLALDWLGGAYESFDPHVVVPLSIGLKDMIVADTSNAEWKGRPDGLVAHVFFRQNANFALSVFAFAVEGWIFYSAVNSVVPQIVLNLGFADNAWTISVRQLSYQLVTLVVSIPIVWYTIRFKDMQTPLIICFGVFFIVTICYANIRPSWSSAQLGINVLCGIGQAGPLSLLVACVQFSAPHAFLSTATGLAFSARAIGGAFGSAVLNAIINGRLSAYYAPAVGAAATSAGLSAASVPRLLEYLEQGSLPEDAAASSGITPEIWIAALGASREEYARAYRLAWSSVIPFVVLAIIAVACLKGVKELMTEKVEATVEHAERVEMGDDEL
ncbi:MFS general substrate transporter [Apiospora saccharicola]|uniref:MFS general substrate transporter n=1 Tax=Apiospora saccharicola TaxID=335842 RepID=A0ABR1U5W0_9PEZI